MAKDILGMSEEEFEQLCEFGEEFQQLSVEEKLLLRLRLEHVRIYCKY